MTYEKLFPESVDILGTPWKIVVKKYDDDPYFKKNSADGYCSWPEHLICICDESTWPTSQDECETFHINCMKATLRHEIVHAFFKESGLNDSSSSYGGAWAKNEEMIDWIALQGQKIYAAWGMAKCLDITPDKDDVCEKGLKDLLIPNPLNIDYYEMGNIARKDRELKIAQETCKHIKWESDMGATNPWCKLDNKPCVGQCIEEVCRFQEYSGR